MTSYKEIHRRVMEFAGKNPTLKRTFELEAEYLAGKISRGEDTLAERSVLDVGCADGRTLKSLARLLDRQGHPPTLFTGIEKDVSHFGDKVRLDADGYAIELDNCSLWRFAIGYNPKFDLVYSSFNTIGHIEGGQSLSDFVRSMASVVKSEGIVSNITWGVEREVTEFMAGYYSAVGFKDVKVAPGISWMRDDEGKLYHFERPNPWFLAELYDEVGLKDVEVNDVSPLWVAISGRKK